MHQFCPSPIHAFLSTNIPTYHPIPSSVLATALLAPRGMGHRGHSPVRRDRCVALLGRNEGLPFHLLTENTQLYLFVFNHLTVMCDLYFVYIDIWYIFMTNDCCLIYACLFHTLSPSSTNILTLASLSDSPSWRCSRSPLHTRRRVRKVAGSHILCFKIPNLFLVYQISTYPSLVVASFPPFICILPAFTTIKPLPSWFPLYYKIRHLTHLFP